VGQGKKPNMFILCGLYERAIAEAARRQFAGEEGAETALRSFWGGYCDILVSVGSVWHGSALRFLAIAEK
jgi:hypothetical protein